MKLFLIAVASALAQTEVGLSTEDGFSTELSRSKRVFTPQECRAHCDTDYDYGIVDDKDSCYETCGMTNAVAEEANAELGSCQK